MLRKIHSQFSSLDEVKSYIEGKNQFFECSIQIDRWVDSIIMASNKCLVVKKTGTAGAKVVMVEPNVVNVEAIMPSHFFNNFRRGILAILLELSTASAQKKVANQVDDYLKQIEK